MYPLISSALDLTKIRSPAVGMLIEQLHKAIRGQMTSMFGNAIELTVSNPEISDKDREILNDRKFVKNIPKNLLGMEEMEFCRIVCTLTRRDRKSKQLTRLDDRTARVLYHHLQREVLVIVSGNSELYQKFMLKATKRNLNGWQELSQRIGNFNAYANFRINKINMMIEDALREPPSHEKALPDNLVGARLPVGEVKPISNESWMPKGDGQPLTAPGQTTSGGFHQTAGNDIGNEKEITQPIGAIENQYDKTAFHPPSDIPNASQNTLIQPPDGFQTQEREIIPISPDTQKLERGIITPTSHGTRTPPGESAQSAVPVKLTPDLERYKQGFTELIYNGDPSGLSLFFNEISAEVFLQINGACLEVMDRLEIPREVRLDDRIIIPENRLHVIDNIEFAQGEAVRRYGENTGDPGIIFRLGNIGILTGEANQAMEMYNKSLFMYNIQGNEVGIAASLNKIGLIFIMTGEYDQALVNFQNALEKAETHNNTEIQLESLVNIGHIYRLKGEYDQALQYYERARAITEELNDRKKQAESLSNIGLMYDLKGDPSKAMQTYQRVLHIYEVLEERKDMSNALVAIGGLYAGQGDYVEAMKSYEDALLIAKETGYGTGMCVVMNNIGLVHKAKGDLDSAKEIFKEACQHAEDIGDKRNMSTCLNNLSTIYKEKQDYEKALQKAKLALGLAEEQDDKRNMSTYLNNISMLYRIQGRDRKALKRLERALQISEELGDKSGIAGRLNNIASILYKRGKYEKAMEYLERALPIFEELGSPIAETVKENIDTLKKQMT